MNLTAQLAQSQLKNNKKRTFWTLFGIVISISMLTAIGGVAYALYRMVERAFARLVEEGSFSGDFSSFSAEQMIGFYVVVGIFVAIIVLVGILVMSNAFAMSASERTKQFGILKSVGATKRQIASTVRFEAVWLSIIGIPFGLVSGTALQLGVAAVINFALVNINIANGYEQYIEYLINVPLLALSAVIGFITVLVSAHIPAKKAARVSAMDAIRGTTPDVEKKARLLRSSVLLGRFFGAEGLLAAKYMRLNKKRYAAIVRALTISTVLLIVGGAFAENLNSAFSLAFRDVPYNVVVSLGDDPYGRQDPVDVSADRIDELSATLDTYENAQIAFVKYNPNNTAKISKNSLTADYRKYVSSENTLNANLISFDKTTYERILKLAGAAPGDAIVLNRWSVRTGNTSTVFTPFSLSEDTIVVALADGTSKEMRIGGELKEFPIELSVALNTDTPLNIIVPDCVATRATWLVNATDTADFLNFYHQELEDEDVMFLDLETDKNASSSVQTIFNTVLFVFVGAIVLIGLTCVISTIATQSVTRRKELAILRSVGQTDAGMLKIFALESLVYGTKALAYGLILGVPLAYFSITASVDAMMTVQTDRLMPYGSIAAAVGVIALLVICTTLYSVRLSRAANVIEAIRGE